MYNCSSSAGSSASLYVQNAHERLIHSKIQLLEGRQMHSALSLSLPQRLYKGWKPQKNYMTCPSSCGSQGKEKVSYFAFWYCWGSFLKTLGKVSVCVTTLSYPPRNEERKEKIVFLLSPECETWTDTSALTLNPRANKILNSYINQETR